MQPCSVTNENDKTFTGKIKRPVLNLVTYRVLIRRFEKFIYLIMILQCQCLIPKSTDLLLVNFGPQTQKLEKMIFNLAGNIFN